MRAAENFGVSRYKLFTQVKDSIFNLDATEEVANIRFQYEFDKKEALQKKEQEKRELIYSEEAKRHQQQIFFVVLFILLVFGACCKKDNAQKMRER